MQKSGYLNCFAKIFGRRRCDISTENESERKEGWEERNYEVLRVFSIEIELMQIDKEVV